MTLKGRGRAWLFVADTADNEAAYVPEARVVASIVTDTVAGNLFTLAGDTVQRFPLAKEHDKVTVAEKPSCPAMTTGAVTLFPDFTSGRGVDWVSVKSGLVVTVSDNGCVFVAGAPGVLAVNMMEDVPAGVVYGTVKIPLTLTGAPLLGLAVGGVNAHVTPEGNPLHPNVTVPANEPDAFT